MPFGSDAECVFSSDNGSLYIDAELLAWVIFDKKGKSVNTMALDMLNETNLVRDLD